MLVQILLHCSDEAGRSTLGPTRPSPEGEAFLRNTYYDTPVIVPATCVSGFKNIRAKATEPTRGCSHQIRYGNASDSIAVLACQGADCGAVQKNDLQEGTTQCQKT